MKVNNLKLEDIILLSEQPESLSYLLYSIGKEYSFEGYRIFDTVLKVGISPFRIIKVRYSKGEVVASDISYLKVSKGLEDSLNTRVLNEGINLDEYLSKGDILSMKQSEDKIIEPYTPKDTGDKLTEPLAPKLT